PKLWYHGESGSYVVTLPDAGEEEEDKTAAHCSDVTDIVWHREHAKYLGVDIPAPRQHGFKDSTGHFAGSCDAEITNLPFVELLGLDPSVTILGEFKTHGEKSFKK